MGASKLQILAFAFASTGDEFGIDIILCFANPYQENNHG